MSNPQNVDVVLGTNPDGVKTAVIQDQAARRSWSGEGATHDEAATQATRKFMCDRRVREYLPS